VIIKVLPLRSQCRTPLPLMSTGGIVLRETYCILPAGHEGPHRDAFGGAMVNRESVRRQVEKGTL
jgi:hypothetical protein